MATTPSKPYILSNQPHTTTNQIDINAITANISCYAPNACDQLQIRSASSPHIDVALNMYSLSEGVEIYSAFWKNLNVTCGAPAERRYIRYPTGNLLDAEAVLKRARDEYEETNRLQCEDITVFCANDTVFEDVAAQQCTFEYEIDINVSTVRSTTMYTLAIGSTTAAIRCSTT